MRRPFLNFSFEFYASIAQGSEVPAPFCSSQVTVFTGGSPFVSAVAIKCRKIWEREDPCPVLSWQGMVRTHIAFYLVLQLCKLIHESSMQLDLRQVSFQVGKLTDRQTSKCDIETPNETMKGEKLVLASISRWADAILLASLHSGWSAREHSRMCAPYPGNTTPPAWRLPVLHLLDPNKKSDAPKGLSVAHFRPPPFFYSTATP